MGVDRSSHTGASEFRYLGYRRLENQKVGIESSEIPQKRSASWLTPWILGIRGCSTRLLDSWSREFRSAKKLRKGIVRRREFVGKKIPDRELGEPLSYSGQEERKVLCEQMCPARRGAWLRHEWDRFPMVLLETSDKITHKELGEWHTFFWRLSLVYSWPLQSWISSSIFYNLLPVHQRQNNTILLVLLVLES